MKNSMFVLLLAGCFCIQSHSGYAQIKDPFKKVEKEGERRTNKTVDKSVKKGFDEIEKGIGGLLKGKKDENEEKAAAPQETVPSKEEIGVQKQENLSTVTKGPELVWAKYDFVPGDKVIFEDNLLGEENGEFPSRWDLVNGNVEVVVFGGENVIMFRDGAPEIIPYMKNPKSDYLPEVFTVEFDLYLPGETFSVYFHDRKNQGIPKGSTYLGINKNSMWLRPARSSLPGGEDISRRWAHISIAYTSGRMKAYIDETRLINIPRMDFDPTGISLHAYHARDNTDRRFYIKNIRIAEGGVKYYNRLMQDGKIIVNGIRFDVNKSSLRPESMGIINEIAGLMKEHPDISFSVEGHTDSDGDDALNKKLSEERAATVVSTLIKMGIAPERMDSKGWGESQPLDTNATPEGKANNRRVEFVKM